MTDDRRREREEAALDALIVLALRGGDEDGADDEIDPADLPELSEAERAAMEALGTPEEFVARMMAEADRRAAGQSTGS